MKSPYQAARKPAFSDSLGPRKAFPKIPWEPKVVDEGPLLSILKTQECIIKNKVWAHFGLQKTSGSPPPPVESVFQKLLKRRTTCKNAGMMAFFLILKKELFFKKCFFLQLALFLFFCVFLETPYQAATKQAFLGEQARGKIQPRRFKRVFCLTCFRKYYQIHLFTFSWPHFCFK